MSKLLKVLSIALLLSSLDARAGLIFDFSFENLYSNNLGGLPPGSVTGRVVGLNEGTGAAAYVDVLTNTSGFGTGRYAPGNQSRNLWTVTNGQLTFFDFVSLGWFNTLPNVVDASLVLTSEPGSIFGDTYRAGLSNFASFVVEDSSRIRTFQINLSFSNAGTVPVAGSLSLVASALAVFLFSVRHTKRVQTPLLAQSMCSNPPFFLCGKRAILLLYVKCCSGIQAARLFTQISGR